MLGFETSSIRAAQRAEQQAERARIEASRNAAAPSGEAAAPTPRPSTRAREQVLAHSRDVQRVPIDTPAVDGSISLEGARFDDLNLRQYRRTVETRQPAK